MVDDKLLDRSYGFFTLATQYYVAGRFAVQSGVMPVGANLLHHAVEMYLKAHLCKTIGLDELKQDISHFLNKAWKKFRLAVGDSSLGKFDSVIDELNQFENLRYPDTVSEYGACIKWSSTPEKVFIHTQDARVKYYHLELHDIDELIEAVIRRSEINPQSFKGGLSHEALSVLCRDNSTAIWR